MLQRTYKAKDEFELYGVLVKELSKGDFHATAARILCYSKRSYLWELVECLETSTEAVCGDYFQTMKDKYFVVLLDPQGAEVTFHCNIFSILGRFESGHLSVIDFEDLNPNEAFKGFEKRELKDSVVFLKKVLQEG